MNRETSELLEALKVRLAEAKAYTPYFGDPGVRGRPTGPVRDYALARAKGMQLTALLGKLADGGDDDKVRAEATALCAKITDILK